MMRTWAVFLAMFLLAGTCHADEAEEAGLRLADTTPAQQVDKPDYQFSVEPAFRVATMRPDDAMQTAERLSIDLAVQKAFAKDWKFNFADHLDLNGPQRFSGDPGAINTLKELYVNGRIGDDGQTLVDIGRVNMRLGVATGYNPTDYFRDNAVRSVTSVDPASLRENRLGTVMLRGQRVWTGGSVTALVAPKLASEPNDAAFAVDLGATNQNTRWLMAVSQHVIADLSPQFLLYSDGKPGSSPQFGVNLTHLLNKACVGYVEWTGGRSPSTLARALQQPESDVAFRWQMSTGLTCTTTHNLSVTFEYEHDGAALDKAGWEALQKGPPQQYLAYRNLANAQQDPTTRDNLFLMLRWQDAFVPRLDLSGFIRMSLADHSRLTWLEARYHFTRTDVALQWQLNSGSNLSEFGALPQHTLWQVLVKHYF
ncbi:hypothetical protein FVF58_34780 [Paraburkholderia panacisoli]|jgi:hypothetical protein|uniref:Alginate export domain-containing protein n=1 Tax=Paraburkholderia panacisoli TaxID=2603818 RepID=A0A5B0GK68_9BURK|nr:hypothetical protein [Paraburkholderia panacisoli]KAA1003847.1 hypothetical protein FVF58_34780 [Paraburkholderia panacisoli]